MNFHELNFHEFEFAGGVGRMRFKFCPADVADKFWDVLSPYVSRVIEKACHGEFTEDNIRQLVRLGNVVLGVGEKNGEIAMVVGVESIYYPNASAVNVLAMAGRGVDEFMRDILPRFAYWLRGKGVDWIECSVSPGMERIHKRYGFETVYRNMRYGLKEKNVTTNQI